ncbi:MAG: 5'/3'-nucleotidase SurE [Rhizobiales bacterium]|nr:5'/3'-nucleotidase SurE [Hyphomicrobiales bacterium]
MRILITNDDGVHAPGLDVCAQIARQLSDDVWIVAPETDQSGVSHSLSLNDPLRLRKVGERHFAVKGTPTDCVIMGVRNILDRPPDLILSGVNRGQNVAGTVLGVTSFALSQAYGAENRQNPPWDTALAFAPDIIRRALDAGVPKEVLVNINFPNCAADEIAGVVAASQGKRDQELLRIDARVDGRGNPYYWIAFARRDRPEPRDGTDLSALANRKISVTPLQLDLTDEPFMTKLAATLADETARRASRG